jgi:hypothetical protein
MPSRRQGLAPGPTSPGTPPTTINASFDGVDQDTSNWNCQLPDVNAAVGISEIAPTVNLRLQVFNKTGAALCGVATGG